ncbi:cbb3-type cytochrome oxidase assembly protein CcoS [Porticoccus sp. W117]|uniref:cbb3-type cytochrome oxidase assembly protein CcoS n=1 Tax=Porticoccus sp. W117 TaxID=3054777 RepID=UPI002599E113|nr:cbb3-type cytochrome oxidase assembly protein CcoS [Porticoccus sp. W117]MDM3871641.1 cbb3-type cytochrome oxidase assembly protein CcoS [Porticoccus sp. W117]
MASLYLLIPITILLLLIAVGVYFWAVKSGQYDDLDGEAERILFDDEPEGEDKQ